MRTSWVLIGLLLGGCDTVERVESLDRKIEVLEEQERASAKAIDVLAEDLANAQAQAEAIDARSKSAAEDATARISSLEKTVALLEAQVEELDAKAPVVPPPVATPKGRPDPDERYRVKVDGSATKGPADAKITLVMIGDYQCPFCQRAHKTMKDIEREYGEDVRFVAKHNPLAFHKEAQPAALAAEAARAQGKFWEMHDVLYDQGRKLAGADYAALAKKAGCNARTFKSDLRDAKHQRRIDDDQALAKRVGARGTPAFFINGRYLAGAQPFESFKRVIDEELKVADERLADGISASELYDDLMRSAKTSP